ncbi:sugar transferase, PEP-CTERM/EpsH1 system associated [Sphingomonas gellani]|uniref:Sugar transferase, PEP-CTERM/EpsH1 system associated n=1 Tax=Sphingomonas gellani TaxID=1166340 RepID=A0A1H7YBM4_9SPHN|nr:sugar transferase, PEP-CTERM/EpsH1 system associated [Sphingomonas gellani]
MDILFLAHRAPFPPDRGDRIRSYHVLRHLAARARVHLVAFVDEAQEANPAPELQALTASCTLVHRRKSRALALIEGLATGCAASVAAFADRQVAQAVRRVLAEHPIGAIYAFSGQMAQYLPPTGRRVMDFVDVDSAKFADLSGKASVPMSWLLAREARLLARFEREVAARVDASLFVSDAEAALFLSGGGDGRVDVVENGIDAVTFAPDVAPEPSGADIVFTGQMDYAPNVEAATWFATEVLPTVQRTHPQVRFAIVGRAPTAAVRDLARRPGVIVTGAVADTRPWLSAAKLAVAPLHLARGIQNKVLEAMAMALPVVATPTAAEGIDHRGTLRVADGPEPFAAAVTALLNDVDAADALGRAARAQVLARYDWNVRLQPLAGLLGFPEA